MAAKTTRMIRTILLIAASCLAWLGAGAQQYEGAHLKFESSFHNFGSVPRWGGDLVWEFEYTTDGSVSNSKGADYLLVPEGEPLQASSRTGRNGCDPCGL